MSVPILKQDVYLVVKIWDILLVFGRIIE
jgi:hypothetical protein